MAVHRADLYEVLASHGDPAPIDRCSGSASKATSPEVTTWTVLLGREVTFLAVPIGRGQV